MKSKKGFTLAELLIVVAIIAILAAIAVPLFVGAMNDAEKAVAEGNCRAVKAVLTAIAVPCSSVPLRMLKITFWKVTSVRYAALPLNRFL